MVHGGGAWLYSFRHLFQHFSQDTSLDVHAIDMPGHGWSSHHAESSKAQFDMADMTSALQAYCSAVGVKQPVDLIGNSWGGGWCLAYAQQFPERVRSLVLLNSSGFEGKEVFLYESLKLPIWGELSAFIISRRIARSFYRSAFFDRSLVSEEMVDLAFEPMANSFINRMAQVSLMRNLDWRPVEEAMGNTTTPSLVIWGQEDKLWPVSMAARFERCLPNCRARILHQCGHLPHEEKPRETIDLISEFWAGN